jgi:hypothetical protein
MKNLIKLLGVIALAAAIVFSMTACPKSEGDKISLGDKLRFSNEHVYVGQWNEREYTVDYKPYIGADVTFINIGSAIPKIVKGKFSFSGEVPAAQSLQSIDVLLSSYRQFTNVEVSDTTVKFFYIDSFEKRTSSRSGISMIRENYEFRGDRRSWSRTVESVTFIYVDKPVTITGNGGTGTYINRDGNRVSVTYNDVNLSLSKGWNTVCFKEETTDTASAVIETHTISVSNPSSLKWVLREYD